ncbi:MAG: FtsX-like permease family protein, partial [Solirubrobacterales bacterium]|nr:FtsX-like permease family protein [Solirubrobacterales bacterium]
MVGLGLVVFVAVFANGLKSSFTGSIEDRFKADMIVTSDQGTPISREAEGRARATLGVRATTAQYADQIQVDGKGADQLNDILNGTDPRTLPLMYDFQWVDGNDQLVSWIGPGTAVVEEQFALTHGLVRGDAFNVKAATGRELRLRVLGIYRDPQLLTGVIVDYRTFSALSSVTDPIGFYVKDEPGADKAKVQASVEAAMRAFPSAKVRNKQQYQDFIGDQFNRIVYLLYALLAMSVVISLFGIANSLYLAVHERTRELGVLRAIGATAEQVRRLVRYESVITSVIGGILGIVVGLVFAYLTTLALDDLGLGFSVPVLQLVVLLGLAVAVGVVGAVAPARRASKVDVVEAVGAGQ